ncbi:PTS sugar transporter subunit IIA [Rubinisphaera sp.]|uniref:PTS sugar transporter subunit IIA n=1 Tax=Rubinisphaera sp. TaxID=2024857 RepID=UPI000C10F8CA|nr:PTS sugar transporter subunit IIA [Rubinisphaera sp.]MBV09526.1 PTS fructose transporter subunit IIABC [Rubinisphaera sp.]
MSTPQMMTIEDLSRYMGRDLREVEKLAAKNLIPGRKIDGKWTFQLNEIRTWIESEFDNYSPDEWANLETSQQSEDVDQDFPVSSLLTPANIEIPIQARTKRSVLERLVYLAGKTWQVWSPDEVLKAVVERENANSTALEGGIAIPHPGKPMPEAVGESVISFGRSINGIPFGGTRGLTDLFFLILCRDNTTHLQILARLGRLFLIPGFVVQLREAETPEDAWQVIADAEKTLG